MLSAAKKMIEECTIKKKIENDSSESHLPGEPVAASGKWHRLH